MVYNSEPKNVSIIQLKNIWKLLNLEVKNVFLKKKRNKSAPSAANTEDGDKGQ